MSLSPSYFTASLNIPLSSEETQTINQMLIADSPFYDKIVLGYILTDCTNHGVMYLEAMKEFFDDKNDLEQDMLAEVESDYRVRADDLMGYFRDETSDLAILRLILVLVSKLVKESFYQYECIVENINLIGQSLEVDLTLHYGEVRHE